MRLIMKVREPAADSAPGARSAGRLYGRESETALLASALDAVAGRRPRLLTLEGAAGTGRTALLARARADARRRGWSVLSGHGAILETSYEYGVLRQLLGGLPPLPDGRPAPALPPPDDDVSPFEVFELVNAHLRKAVQGVPALITVDDLHWCDPLTLRWLAYLAHRSADLPLALVLAMTPGETSERRVLTDELVGATERRTLHRLTAAQTGQWITDALGARPDAAFAEACHRATAGNPALLAAVLPALAARSVPPVRASRASIEGLGRVAVSRCMLPWITRGGPEAVAVAQAVAVLGDDSEPVLVAKLAELGLDEAAGTVDRLIKLGVLADGSPLRYVQPLVRTAVDAGISTGLRTSHRLRAARLVRDHCADPERAAAHLMAVEVCGERWALDVLRAAARSALDRGLAPRALVYLRRALAEPLPDAVRARLLADLGAAEVGAGIADGESTLLEALALAGEPPLRARIGVDLAWTHASTGRPLTTALKIVEEACAALPAERAEVVVEAELGAFFACAATADAGGFPGRRLPGLRVLTAGDARLSALAGVAVAWADARRGRDRPACVRRARAALRAVDLHRTWESRLRLPAAGVLIAADACDLADDPGEGRAPRTAGEAAITSYLRGCVLYGRGDLESARTELGTALENPYVAGTTGIADLVRVLTDLGDLDAADRLIRERGTPSQSGPAWVTALLAFAKAALRLARDQHEEALKGFLEAADGQRVLGIENPAVSPWRSQAARCHAALGDARAAEALAAQEVDLARRWGAPRALSTALAASGVVNADPDAARDAVAVLDPLDADLHRATALVDLGTVLLKTGGAEAQEHLQEGFALAHVIGARPVWLRASRRIRRAGGKPDLSRISGVTALTAQERAVAERAAGGATNRQIAEDMVLTQRTIEQYLTSAYRKLGVSGRRELPAALSA
jgi:DNA-binding CsgD family transcriptional regulator